MCSLALLALSLISVPACRTVGSSKAKGFLGSGTHTGAPFARRWTRTGTGRKARASLIVLAFVFPLPGWLSLSLTTTYTHTTFASFPRRLPRRQEMFAKKLSSAVALVASLHGEHRWPGTLLFFLFDGTLTVCIFCAPYMYFVFVAAFDVGRSVGWLAGWWMTPGHSCARAGLDGVALPRRVPG